MSLVSRIVHKSAASLFWCMRGLPKAKREAVYTLYAFIHHLDSIESSDLSLEQKNELFEAWKIELQNIFVKKAPETEIGRKIYKMILRFKIKQEDFELLLKAAKLDFPSPLQAPKKSVFEQYILGNAVIPVYLTLLIMGELKEKPMRTLADNFGNAIALTNILRNIKDDALEGHLYIFEELLTECKIFSKDPMTVVRDPNLTAARQKIAYQAAVCFQRTYKMMSATNKKTMRPLRFIFHIYKRYFDIMQKRGWEIISPKPQIKAFDQLMIAFNTVFEKY